MSVETGQPFPAFTAKSQEGETVDLAEYRGDQNLVVFFYPRATTPGCVRETTEFSARIGELEALNTRVVGISVDDVDLQKQHGIQCAASFPLLCDTDKSLTTQLDILNERGMSKRTTYILDGQGIVRTVFAGVTVDGHVDQVIGALKQMA
jgi:peroxiredoxin Q/BCP